MAKKLGRPAKLSTDHVGTAGAELTGQGVLQTRRINVSEIRVGSRLRRVDEAAIAALSESMAEIGLKTPISVRLIQPTSVNETGEERSATSWALVAGAHRLAAAKRLGWKTVTCIVVTADDVEANLWEIAENLHRAELTVQQRADYVAAYLRFKEKRSTVSSQVEAKPLGGRPRGGLRAAARDLGLDKSEVARAVKIASITEEARSAVNSAKLDDNQSALLEIASAPTTEAQVAKVEEIASHREGRRARNKVAASARHESTAAGKPAAGSDAIAAQEGRAVRETAFDAIAELLARRLGKEAHRFVRLSQDAGSNGLRRLAAAIERRLAKAGSAAAADSASAAPHGPPTSRKQLTLT